MSGPWAGKWIGTGSMYANIREIVGSHWDDAGECCACLRVWPCAAYRLASEMLDMLVIPQ